MSEPNLSLDPKLLGFWVKCIREASNWSQEAVAATAGLDVRTIQRAEAGSSISLASRRSLARGLGFDDYDIFQKPEFIDAVQFSI
jgi:transcriptional regulator with XRE-family HTH domain